MTGINIFARNNSFSNFFLFFLLNDCPNFCTISYTPRLYYSSFIFIGDGDDNAVYKLWNEKVVSKDA